MRYLRVLAVFGSNAKIILLVSSLLIHLFYEEFVDVFFNTLFPVKEKYEEDLKKEIKKLQEHKYFRQLANM